MGVATCLWASSWAFDLKSFTKKPLKEHILHCGNKIQILEFQSIEKSKINFDNIFLIPDMVFMNGSITTSSLAFSMLAYLKSTQNLSGFIKPKAYLVLFSSQVLFIQL